MLTPLREALAARLLTMPMLEGRVLAFPPDTLMDGPYAYVSDPTAKLRWHGRAPITYGDPAWGSVTVQLAIVVVADATTNYRVMRSQIDEALALTGPNSLVQALRLDPRLCADYEPTLEGTCDSAVLLGLLDYEMVNLYAGIWMVECIVSAP